MPPIPAPCGGTVGTLQAKMGGPPRGSEGTAPARSPWPPPPSGGVVQRGKKFKKKDDDEDAYQPSSEKNKHRSTFGKSLVKQVVKNKAHRRKHIAKGFKYVFTCPGCRRPLAFRPVGGGFTLTKYSYTSKKNKNVHTQRAVELDHYPPWSGRLDKLTKKGASESEIRSDHDDPDRLRALCRVCNGGHSYESKKTVDYTSDKDEEGYETDPDETDNAGRYSPYRYFPPPGGGAGGIVT